MPDSIRSLVDADNIEYSVYRTEYIREVSGYRYALRVRDLDAGENFTIRIYDNVGSAIDAFDAATKGTTADLLAACEAIAALAEGQGRANLLEVAGQARDAIAKAKGSAE